MRWYRFSGMPGLAAAEVKRQAGGGWGGRSGWGLPWLRLSDCRADCGARALGALRSAIGLPPEKKETGTVRAGRGKWPRSAARPSERARSRPTCGSRSRGVVCASDRGIKPASRRAGPRPYGGFMIGPLPVPGAGVYRPPGGAHLRLFGNRRPWGRGWMWFWCRHSDTKTTSTERSAAAAPPKAPPEPPNSPFCYLRRKGYPLIFATPLNLRPPGQRPPGQRPPGQWATARRCGAGRRW